MAQRQTSPETLEMLSELERSTPEAIKQQRAHTRLTLRCRTIVQPGNASERTGTRIQAMTGDLSAGGCQLLTPIPLRVGDIYHLAFDQEVIAVPPQLAKCMRCRVVRDDAYESGFAFFAPVDIAVSAGAAPGSEGLLARG